MSEDLQDSVPRFHPFLTYWLPWILWMALIFFLSDRPKQESLQMSGWFLIFFEWLGYTYAELEAMQVVLLIRKLAHFTIYLILALWTVRLQRYYLPGKKFPWWAILWCLLYAISDEVHQAFVPGRGPQPIDVGIDLLGALFGAWLWIQYEKRYISK